MNLLALDTSSVACTAGVLCNGETFVRYEERPREHTSLLIPMLRAVLAESGLGMSDLDAIVLGNGPGSFIGLRIAASVAQGLAHGARLDIAPVSSLAAIAYSAGEEADVIAVTGDAHMNQVYLGLYRRGDAEPVTALAPERLQAPERIAELPEDAQVVAAGSGWQRYPALLAANRAAIKSISNVRYPQAAALLALGRHGVESGRLIAPEKVSPAYLRHKVAEKPRATGP